MGDLSGSDVSPKFSRRDLLKLASVVVGTTALYPFGRDLEEAALDTSLNVVPDGMVVKIPEEFKAIEIPKKNEFYRPPNEILQQAFDTYDQWRKGSNLPQVSFKKEENYLSMTSLLSRFPKAFHSKEGDNYYKLAQIFFPPTALESAKCKY